MIGQKRNDTNVKWVGGGEISVASKNNTGIVQIGDGIDVTDNGVISTTYENIPIASKDGLGAVQIGDGINVTDEGVISTTYENIPIASNDTLGAVKIGDGVEISVDGTISVEDYVLPPATADTLGGVKIGDGVNVDIDGTISVNEYDLPIATAESLGGVKIGDGINIESDGTISAQEYTLPIASAENIGGVKIGEGIEITEDGTISAQEYTLPIATNDTLGGVKIGDGINVTDEGVISAQEYSLPIATNVTLGGIIVGDGLTVDEEGVISTVGSLEGSSIREYTDFATFLYNTESNEYYLSEAPVKRSDYLSTGKSYMVLADLHTYNNGEQRIEIWNGNKSDLIMNDQEYTIQRDSDGNIIDNDGSVINSVDGTYTIDANGLYKDGTKIANIYSDKINKNVSAGSNNVVTGEQNQLKGTDCIMGGYGNYGKDISRCLILGNNNSVANRHDDCVDNIINGYNGYVIDTKESILNISSRTTTNPGYTKYYSCIGVIGTGTSNKIRATDSVIAGGGNYTGTFTEYVDGDNTNSFTTTAGLDAIKNSFVAGASNGIKNSDGLTSNLTSLTNSLLVGDTNIVKGYTPISNNIIGGKSNGIGTYNNGGYNQTDMPFVNVVRNIISGYRNCIEGGNSSNVTNVYNSIIIGESNRVITSSSSTSKSQLANSLMLGLENKIENGVTVENCVVSGISQTITSENALNAVWLSGNSSGSNIIMKNDGSIKAASLNLGTLGDVAAAITALQTAIATKTVELVENSIVEYADITEDTTTIENATHTFTLPTNAITLKAVCKNDESNTVYPIMGVVEVDGVYTVGIRMFDNTDTDIIVSYTI